MTQRIKRIVGFSGGADSQATALWVRNRYPAEDIILLNADAGGNEHPITTRFIADYSANVFPVVTVSATLADLGNMRDGAARDRRDALPDERLTFGRLALVKGRFPSRTAQFCTDYLKIRPQRRWVSENMAGVPFERYTGIRRDESARRADTPESGVDDLFGVPIHHPLARWSKQDVFDFLREAGEEVNPLYRMGFSRVGCAPCVNSGKDDIRNWAARFPEMIDKVREWEKCGSTFFPPCIPGKEINWIDEVVAWSKTERGGKQYSLPYFEAEAASGGCLSDYGLCE